MSGMKKVHGFFGIPKKAKSYTKKFKVLVLAIKITGIGQFNVVFSVYPQCRMEKMTKNLDKSFFFSA